MLFYSAQAVKIRPMKRVADSSYSIASRHDVYNIVITDIVLMDFSHNRARGKAAILLAK